MKSLIQAAVIATALIVPVASFAQQSNSTVTRAQVRAELVQLEKAGYNPAQNDRYYPNDLQAAQSRVDDQNGTVHSSYGGVKFGSSASGAGASASTNGIYKGQ